MLMKWKNILSNWINYCYFEESNDREPRISLDLLLCILSHMRQNLSLDESKSSLIEAQTVEEFIREKYPGFIFTNGTVEANTDDELYMVASLLLLFVCVNSKDIDIKNAMCSKLSTDDQEVILKFSKCLMDCSPVTLKDVQTAIIDACNSDTEMMEPSTTCTTVSETPPALRSLHGEVRRLQAALEAERFDRNYLQEELTRTNLRVEKLSQEKEQYKLDIVNLKAKISMCCGQETEGDPGDKATEGTAKLMKEIQETEERLVETRGQLDEALYERDAYKKKVNELKQERDKWLDLSQQEAARVIQLSEELNVERRHVQSLKELVEELRQHQQLNRLDTSLLECDDPDTSVRSLPHNSSVCSEACANVIEVQLGEERAKIDVLKQQIQSLQEQLNDLTQKSETEIVSLNTILSEKDNDILSLKHRINEEIETRNKLVAHYSDQNSRLNNEINELEQMLKDNKNQHRIVLESKIQDIQTLQEEKLSLLQSLNDETTKMEDTIKILKRELAAEKDSKLKLKEDYNNHIMNLNEKILNRNNELVEIQNNVFEKSERIEDLHLELRKEKQAKKDIMEKYHIVTTLQDELRSQKQHQDDIIGLLESEKQILNQKLEESKSLIESQKENYDKLILKHAESYTTLKKENKELGEKIDTERKNAEKEIQGKDEKLAVISSEIMHITFENDKLQNEWLSEKKCLAIEIETLKTEMNSKIHQIEILESQKQDLYATLQKCKEDIALLEENNNEIKLIKDSQETELLNKVEQLSKELFEQQTINKKQEQEIKQLQQLNAESKNQVIILHNEIETVVRDKTILEKKLNDHREKSEKVESNIVELHKQIDKLQNDNKILGVVIEDHKNVVKSLQDELRSQKQHQDDMIDLFESEKQILNQKLEESKSLIESQKENYDKLILKHAEAYTTLKKENKELEEKYYTERKNAEKEIQEKDEKLAVISSEIMHIKFENDKLQNELLSEKECLAIEIETLKTDMNSKIYQIEILESQKQDLNATLQKCKEDVALLEENNNEIKIIKDSQEIELLNKVDKLSEELFEQQTINKKQEQEIKQLQQLNTESKNQVIILHNKIETVVRDKIILEKKLNDHKEKCEEAKSNIVELHKQIDKLQNDNKILGVVIEDNKTVVTTLQDELGSQKQHQDDMIGRFESEKQTLNLKLEESKSLIESQKENYDKLILQHAEAYTTLKKENKELEEKIYIERKKAEKEIQEKDEKLAVISSEIMHIKSENDKLQNELLTEKQCLTIEIETLKTDRNSKIYQIEILESQKHDLNAALQKCKEDIALLEKSQNEIKIIKDSQETELVNKVEKLSKELFEQQTINKRQEQEIKQLQQLNAESKNQVIILHNEKETVVRDKTILEKKLNDHREKCEEAESNIVELHKQIDKLQNDNEILGVVIEDNKTVISSLENEIQNLNQLQEKYVSDFNLEREKLKKMISVSESIIEEHKVNLKKVTLEYNKFNEALKEDIKKLQENIDADKKEALRKLQEKDTILEAKIRKLYEIINEKENLHKVLIIEKENLIQDIGVLKKQDILISTQVDTLKRENNKLEDLLQQCKNDLVSMEKNHNELKILMDTQETEYNNRLDNISKQYNNQIEVNKTLESALDEKNKLTIELEEKVRALNDQVEVLTKAYNNLEHEKNEYKLSVDQIKVEIAKEDGTLVEEISKLRKDNKNLINLVKDDEKVILNLEEAIKKGRESNDFEILNLSSKCSILEEYQIKAEKLLEQQQKEITVLQEEIQMLKCQINDYEKNLKEKDESIIIKDEKISAMQQELIEQKSNAVKLLKELDEKAAVVLELKQKVNDAYSEDVLRVLRNEEWVRAVGQKDTYVAGGSEKTGSHKFATTFEKDYREFHHQVDNTTSDLTHSSTESLKTISDLEKIIHDKNRTITTLQSDITYLKSLVAESENKLLDVSKELELNKENCQQLSNQLKKIVHQKNEEIAELKKHVNKMSITENRASQIIKVSAKYQAIILKRISEIKANTVLKELTNFGNASNGDNELRRSLNAGTITMEDLENFLESTDKHLRRCSEKQIALQRERDRLTEVNRINESEIINLKKFLTELSVSFKTFSNVKELYTQKLSRVVSVQRTVRREILNLDGRINDATMCKLERGYAATMQDLSECIMNLERWVERSISRTISAEKIKQAFSSDDERASLASTTFQNTSLEVQLEELESSFQKLLQDVVRAQKGEGAKDAQSVTVMEVRAEYEDKLNRMKAKMKELYQEQISVYKERQRNEIAALELELVKTREKLAESSKAYEEHIRSLTTELWRVGEKFLSKKDELEWERKKQRSGSLMSLQHVHSSGLVPLREDQSRISDAHSLRSLPIQNNTTKREGRGLHMSDEEDDVFDNRCLKELASTPRASPPGRRLSELRWRNSFCPPHLKSSYPAETQFAPGLDEEDIKCMEAAPLGGRNQRKEVGITAYKKPGPPTPSKQAGRLSATDSELRESLRPEPEPQVSRKTSTPSRLLLLFRSSKNDTAEGTPRRRLSMFRKK